MELPPPALEEALHIFIQVAAICRQCAAFEEAYQWGCDGPLAWLLWQAEWLPWGFRRALSLS